MGYLSTEILLPSVFRLRCYAEDTGGAMPHEHLATYLNDYLAGSTIAIEHLEDLEAATNIVLAPQCYYHPHPVPFFPFDSFPSVALFWAIGCHRRST